MAGAHIDIDDASVRSALNRLLDAGSHLSAAFKEIGEDLVDSSKARFAAQEDPQGQAWAPLSPAYAKRKARKKGATDLILVLNGYLGTTLHYQATDTDLLIGTDATYGAVHQFGWPEKNIPARPYLGLSDDDRDNILEILDEYLARAISG